MNETAGLVNDKTQRQQRNYNDNQLPRRYLHALASVTGAATRVKLSHSVFIDFLLAGQSAADRAGASRLNVSGSNQRKREKCGEEVAEDRDHRARILQGKFKTRTLHKPKHAAPTTKSKTESADPPFSKTEAVKKPSLESVVFSPSKDFRIGSSTGNL